MQADDEDRGPLFTVVMNDEEQYSIWPAARALPPGWVQNGPTAPKAECLAHIKDVWTDMRPLSLRKAMAADETARRD
jgi:MbtH protein